MTEANKEETRDNTTSALMEKSDTDTHRAGQRTEQTHLVHIRKCINRSKSKETK
jgi:hypothetical protein